MSDIQKQNNCHHIYCFKGTTEKTLEGFYKDPEDYKPGEMYNLYFCLNCSHIEIVDYNLEDDAPVQEFEANNTVIKTEKSYKEIKKELEEKVRRR